MIHIELRHLTADIIERLDQELGIALRSVTTGAVEKASVALTLTAERDEDEETVVTWTQKQGAAAKGRLGATRQPRLPLDDLVER